MQASAPLTTLLNVRTTGQRARADFELEKFRQAWDAKGVKIVPVTFNFTDGIDREKATDPPLSWHLTKKEKGDIDDSWSANLNIEGKGWLEFEKQLRAASQQ